MNPSNIKVKIEKVKRALIEIIKSSLYFIKNFNISLLKFEEFKKFKTIESIKTKKIYFTNNFN